LASFEHLLARALRSQRNEIVAVCGTATLEHGRRRCGDAAHDVRNQKRLRQAVFLRARLNQTSLLIGNRLNLNSIARSLERRFRDLGSTPCPRGAPTPRFHKKIRGSEGSMFRRAFRAQRANNQPGGSANPMITFARPSVLLISEEPRQPPLADAKVSLTPN